MSGEDLKHADGAVTCGKSKRSRKVITAVFRRHGNNDKRFILTVLQALKAVLL